MNLDLEEIFQVADRAAREAGKILAEGCKKPKQVKYKGDINLVTQYDEAAEKIIVGHISEAWPDHHILAEESGWQGRESEYVWYVDPLDGTTNFAHGLGVFCVSIGFEAPGPDGPEIQVAVIYDPIREEMFTALKGQGAYLNGERLEVSGETDQGRALLVTGFPYDLRERSETILPRFQKMLLSAQAVRRLGSAALDLAYVAAGRFDGFWEEGLHPWDTAAGILLVDEAGGRISDFKGNPFRPYSKEILATNGRLHYNMIELLDPERSGQ